MSKELATYIHAKLQKFEENPRWQALQGTRSEKNAAIRKTEKDLLHEYEIPMPDTAVREKVFYYLRYFRMLRSEQQLLGKGWERLATGGHHVFLKNDIVRKIDMGDNVASKREIAALAEIFPYDPGLSPQLRHVTIPIPGVRAIEMDFVDSVTLADAQTMGLKIRTDAFSVFTQRLQNLANTSGLTRGDLRDEDVLVVMEPDGYYNTPYGGLLVVDWEDSKRLPPGQRDQALVWSQDLQDAKRYFDRHPHLYFS